MASKATYLSITTVARIPRIPYKQSGEEEPSRLGDIKAISGKMRTSINADDLKSSFRGATGRWPYLALVVAGRMS